MTKTFQKFAIIILFIAILPIYSCNKNSSPVQNSEKIEKFIEPTDVPCILNNIPVIVGQHDTLGWITMYPVTGQGITIDLNNMPEGTTYVHFNVRFSEISNLAPGQFPVHISNPERRIYTFTYEDLNRNQNTVDYIDANNCNLFYYTHFDVGNETGWAGRIEGQRNKNNKSNRWFYYSNLNCCN